MKTFARFKCTVACGFLLAFLSISIGAEPVDTTDTEVNIWVDNAPMALFIEQLAGLSGRTAEIDAALAGTISGRYLGSINDTLRVVSGDFSVLFDVDKTVIRAADQSAKTSASIPLGGTKLEAEVIDNLSSQLFPGNTIEFEKATVRVTGHPAFVQRLSLLVGKEIAVAREAFAVIDRASNAILEDIKQDAEETETQTNVSRSIDWVTDIPGFNTF